MRRRLPGGGTAGEESVPNHCVHVSKSLPTTVYRQLSCRRGDLGCDGVENTLRTVPSPIYRRSRRTVGSLVFPARLIACCHNVKHTVGQETMIGFYWFSEARRRSIARAGTAVEGLRTLYWADPWVRTVVRFSGRIESISYLGGSPAHGRFGNTINRRFRIALRIVRFGSGVLITRPIDLRYGFDCRRDA